MVSSAAADSGDGVPVAASTTDQRVFGKTRGAALDGDSLLIRTSYPEQLRETRRLLQKGDGAYADYEVLAPGWLRQKVRYNEESRFLRHLNDIAVTQPEIGCALVVLIAAIQNPCLRPICFRIVARDLYPRKITAGSQRGEGGYGST